MSPLYLVYGSMPGQYMQVVLAYGAPLCVKSSKLWEVHESVRNRAVVRLASVKSAIHQVLWPLLTEVPGSKARRDEAPAAAAEKYHWEPTPMPQDLSRNMQALEEYRQQARAALAPVRSELAAWFRDFFRRKKGRRSPRT
jgi:hypothetical protein